MTSDRNVQLGSSLDPTGAQQGLKAIEQAGAKTAAALGQSATTAGKAIDGIGDGGEKAARKLQAAERGIVASIQRATAAAQAGERGTASFYESLARGRGIDPNTLRPYLDQLRAAEQASRAAAAGVGQIGISAAQTAAALRGVPAQFTDIVTSLQGGQAPLTVLLQQGGQLRDMFGSAGAAARALGGFIGGLISPFTLAAAAAAALAYAYKLGSDEASAYSRAIILSGQAAGVTAGQLQAMASGVAALGAGTQGRAAEILAQLASSADVGAGNMQRFTAAALAFEQVGGNAAEETAKAFQALADKPLQAALKLNETTNFLTRRTYEQIKALQEQGRTTDAARVAQEAYATAIESRTPQLAGALGYVERAWLSIKNATKGAFDAALNIGRGNTLDGQIEALRQRIESAQTGIYSRDKVPELRQELALLQEQQRMLQRGAEAAAAQSVALRATADFDKQALEYRKDGKRLADEILQIRQRGLAAGKSEAEVVALIAAVVERTAKTSTAPASKRDVFKAEEAAARSYMQALEALATIQQQAGASSEGLTKTQAKLRDVQADPAWQTYSRQQQEQIITQAASAQAAEDQAAAMKAGAKVAAEAARDYAQWVQEVNRSGSAVAAQVQTLEDEAQAVRIAASGRVTLKQAIEDVALARLREQQAAALGNPDAVLAIQREIDAREKLRGLIGEKEQREAAAGAAKEWARSAEKIGDSITDALMRGFESGKGFAETLRDTVVNMFKSMVLKPVISAIVSPISGAISGAIGGALGLGAASAAAGGLSAGAGVGLAGAGLLGGSLGLFGSGVASGLSAWGAGGSVTGLLSSGSSLFAGGIANGLGTLAGALGPIALGAGAIYALAKSLDNGGTPHVGSIYGIGTDGRNGATLTRQTAGGYQLGSTFSAAGNSTPEIRSTVQQFTTSLAATFGAAMQTFGLRQGDVRAGFAADNDDPSAGRITIRGADGRVLADSFARYAASASKGFEEFAADAGRVLRDALVAADLPGWADGLLVDLGSRPTIEAVQQMVQSIAQLRSVFDAFGGTLGLTQTEVVGLAKAFGGVGELASGLSGYLASVYTDSERLDLAQRSLSSAFAQMGQSVPANAAAYRSLVDAQDLSTEAGRNTYAAMIKLAPAFAEVTAAANEAAAEQARLAEQVATQRNGLETQLLRLYGNTNELRRRELAALDPANRALQERIYALQDQQAIEDAAAQAAEAAAAERVRQAEQVAAEADDLGTRLMQLIGDVAGLRARELAALDPTNRAMQERIFALEDARAAEEAAAAQAQQVAQQGDSLLTRLLQLQGDTATLRARELAALDPANRALQERIFALEDAQAAAQAAQDLAAQWRGVSQTLEDEIKRIGGLNRTQATNLAQVQAEFAVATAQARSGDQAAAERLPELSRTLLDMARGSARSSAELSTVQAGLVASLTQTAELVRGLSAGPLGDAQEVVQSLMPESSAAQFLTADQSRAAASNAAQADMLTELKALRAEVVDLRSEARATATATAAINRLHQRWDGGDGVRVMNDADTPITTTVI